MNAGPEVVYLWQVVMALHHSARVGGNEQAWLRGRAEGLIGGLAHRYLTGTRAWCGGGPGAMVVCRPTLVLLVRVE